MSEIEIHHEHGHHEADPFGKKIGVMVGAIGIVLAAVTIASHREHTNAVIFKTEANDQWAFYQAKKIRGQVLEVGISLADTLGKSKETQDASAKMAAQRDHEAGEADEIKKEAEAKEAETLRAEKRAMDFDLGEGLLELGLVLSSLYFMSRKRAFPYFGGTAALIGAAIAVIPLLS